MSLQHIVSQINTDSYQYGCSTKTGMLLYRLNVAISGMDAHDNELLDFISAREKVVRVLNGKFEEFIP